MVGVAYMEEKLFDKFQISEEGRRAFKLAEALQQAMFDGVCGKLLDLRKLDRENLKYMFEEVQKELSWRATPNDPVGH